MNVRLRLIGLVVALAAVVATLFALIAHSFSGQPLTAAFVIFLPAAILTAISTIVIVRWQATDTSAELAEWLQSLRTGRINDQSDPPKDAMADPLLAEIATLAKSLALARAKEEEDTLKRVAADSQWTPQRLNEHLSVELRRKALLVVSNREPYMHLRHGTDIESIVPAGGLVTALDPVLRAVGGVWIANGSGDADRETADANGKIAVPPDSPLYTLKRVFLSKEDEEGYYYGFSNEGLWPLCHITHTRPTFRLEDFELYQKVNQKFAEAVLEEMSSEEEPLVLIHDYHFALLPNLVKQARPDARVGIFWHIPWPNPEAFGICPWKREILIGMLGADLIGFHAQYHCNNFLETIDRTFESRIDWDQFSVTRRKHLTFVKPFPISIAFADTSADQADREHLRQEIAEVIGPPPRLIGVGVDRIDYTKGIVERLRALERFFEKYSEFIGEFTFVELGAPSRIHLKRYRELMTEIDEAVDRINRRFRIDTWKPVIFLKAHHSHEFINRFYKAADICIVSSLHDGMNLVAKEFVAARDDEDGVLLLSQFTGASRELQDTIIINPYDIEQTADAIQQALTMDPLERTERMRRLRQLVKERNVYRWASNLVTTLARIRLPQELVKAGA